MSRYLPMFAGLTAILAVGFVFSLPLPSASAQTPALSSQAPAPVPQTPAPVQGQRMEFKVLTLEAQVSALQQQIAALQASLDLLKASIAAQLEKQGLPSSTAPKPVPRRSNIPPSRITLLKQTH